MHFASSFPAPGVAAEALGVLPVFPPKGNSLDSVPLQPHKPTVEKERISSLAVDLCGRKGDH